MLHVTSTTTTTTTTTCYMLLLCPEWACSVSEWDWKSVFCWSALPGTTARSLSLQRLSMPSSGTFSFTLPRHRAIHNYVQTISCLTASCYTCLHHVKNTPRIIALYVATIYKFNSGESNLQPLDYEPDVVTTRLFTHSWKSEWKSARARHTEPLKGQASGCGSR